MFEREVTISTLRKNCADLARLVEELEGKTRFNGVDAEYYREALKRIESALRKMRKREDDIATDSPQYGNCFISKVW